MLHQKSSIQWIKEADGDTHYFHHVIKERVIRNYISRLMDEQGQWVEDQGRIKEMVI